MAKSKTGGSRAYIRGRIGSDVYSIGKDGKGKKQQVVRSLAESVANPQTQAQMIGRMIMSTIAQAASALRPIIDHAFDNVSGRQPNISEFTRLNYALIKADYEAHPSSGNAFGLNKYQEKGIKAGAYQVSKGDLIVPAGVAAATNKAALEITLPENTVTVGALREVLAGLSVEGYITLVAIDTDVHAARYVRASLDTDLPDATTITSSNVASLFALEGNDAGAVSLTNNVIEITFTDWRFCGSQGIIISDKVSGQWKHSTCVLKAGSSAAWPGATALPTYPQGENFYLNGGDL